MASRPTHSLSSLLEPNPISLVHSLLVVSENSLLAADALRNTLDNLQEAKVLLQSLLDDIHAEPFRYEDNQS